MIARNSKTLRMMSFGLTLVAVLAIAIALVVGYRENGEVNFVLIALAAVLLSVNLMVVKKSRTRSNDQNS